MSGKTPKSHEFCILDEDGEPDDLALHAGILDDQELTDRLAEKDADNVPGPGLNEKDESDLSDIEGGEYADLLDDDPADA